MATKKPTTQEIIGETKELKRVAAELNKLFGVNTIGREGEYITEAISRVPTGIAKLDRDLGGGFPKGRIVEMYGIEQSGKTLISFLTIKHAQSMGLNCIYIDVEDSYDPVWTKSLGVDISKLYVVKLGVGEDIFEAMIRLLATNPGVIVLDSLAAMTTKNELAGDIEQIHMAPRARLLSSILPRVLQHNRETLIIFINQLRTNLTPMGAFGTVTPGGKAVRHFASIRLRIHKDSDFIYEGEKKSGEVIGQIVQYNVEKNKTSAPNKKGSFKYLYEGSKIIE